MPFVFLAVCGAHFFGVPKYFLISPHLPNLDAIYIDYLIQNTYLPTIRNQHLWDFKRVVLEVETKPLKTQNNVFFLDWNFTIGIYTLRQIIF
jgi:hypothetical protein